MMPSLPSPATPRALVVAAAHQHSALKNTVNASTTPLLRPEHLRVRFNDRVYVSFIPESEPWIDDGLGRGDNNTGLPCNDHNDEDPDQEEDIADLLPEAKSFEENKMVRREQLARGNMVTSPPPFEQDELSLVEGRCPMSPELMRNFEIYLEHVNSKPSKMRQARKLRKRRNTLSVPAQSPASCRPWNVTPRKDMSMRASMPLMISKTGSIAGAGTTKALATGEHSVLEGPATPPEGVASTSYGVGMGLPSTLAGRGPTLRKAGPSRVPSASSVLRELQDSAAYANGLSFTDEPFTYVMSAHTRRMPSSIAGRTPTPRVFTTRFQQMEDLDWMDMDLYEHLR